MATLIISVLPMYKCYEQVNEAEIIETDIITTNGLVHVVDDLILPQNRRRSEWISTSQPTLLLYKIKNSKILI